MIWISNQELFDIWNIKELLFFLRLGQKMYKISLVFWRMGELGILLSIFTDL